MPRHAGVSAAIAGSGGSSAGAPSPGPLASSLSSMMTEGHSKQILDVPNITVRGSSPSAMTPLVESVSGVNRRLAGSAADPEISNAGPSASPASPPRLTTQGAGF